MIEQLFGPSGADLFYVTICMLVCLGICTFCESLKPSRKEQKTIEETHSMPEMEIVPERLTEPSDWAALSERKKLRAAEKRMNSGEERKIA